MRFKAATPIRTAAGSSSYGQPQHVLRLAIPDAACRISFQDARGTRYRTKAGTAAETSSVSTMTSTPPRIVVMAAPS